MLQARTARLTSFLLFLVPTSAIVAVSLAACGVPQSEIDDAVAATQTVDRRLSDLVATGVASTLSALPSPTALPPSVCDTPTPPMPSPTTTACAENMDDLRFLGASILASNQFMITLQKDTPFLAGEYALLVDAKEHACSILENRTDRIFCVGKDIPDLPEGSLRLLAEVELSPTGGGCYFDLPFDTIPLPPKPTPDSPSGGGTGAGYP
jgi:hypothetical protein